MPTLRSRRLRGALVRATLWLGTVLLGACHRSSHESSPVSPSESAVVVAPAAGVVANGTSTAQITITVRDRHGRPLAQRRVQVLVSGTQNELDVPDELTDGSGMAVAHLASIAAETKVVTVLVASGGSQVELDEHPSVSFVADASNLSPSLSSASAGPAAGLLANGVDTSTLTVTVRDANANVVAGQTVEVAASGASNTLAQPAAPTDSSGIATATLASTTAELKTLTILVNPGPAEIVLDDQPIVEFVADLTNPSAFSSSATAAPASGVIANGTDAATITVTVRDAGGNVLPGQTVEIAASGSGNTLGQPASGTDAAGVATATLAATVAETKTVTVTVNPGPAEIVLLQQPDVRFVGDPATLSATLSSASAAPSSGVVADGLEAATITVTVRDANGNAVAGRTVQIAASGSGNAIGQSPELTDASGLALATLAATVAETKSVTVTIDPGAAEIVLADQPGVSFVADASNLSPSLSSASASPSAGLIADGADSATITVTVRDANGNAVAGRTVQIAASGSGNTIGQPAALTDASGVATGTLAAIIAETKVVTVTVDPGPSEIVLDDQPGLVFAGDPSTISSSLSSIAAVPTFGARANGAEAVEVIVTVRDANGNPVPSQSVTLSATGQGNALGQPMAPSDGAGEASGSLTTTVAEDKVLAAQINPGPSAVDVVDSASATFVWNRPGHRYVRASGSDANDGASPARAWRTLGMAAGSVVPGDVVHVGAGTYQESVQVTTDGSATDPIAFLADETGELTGDSGEVVVDSLGAPATFTIDGADDVLLEGFVIVGARQGDGAGIIVGTLATNRVKIRRNHIHSNGNGIVASNADNLVLERNRISRHRRSAGLAARAPSGGHGITLDATNAPVVRNNLVYANEGDGILVTGGALSVLVRSNTLYANEGDQVRIDGLLNVADLSDNVLSQGLADGIELVPGSIAISSFNLSFGHLGLDWLGLPPGSGDLSNDPLFVDPDGADGILGAANGADDRFELDSAAPSPGLDSGSLLATALALDDGSTFADLTSRSDGVLDGTPPDGAFANVGFHYEAGTGALSGLVEGDARLAYGEGVERQARVRTWDGDLASFGAEALAPPAGATVRWIVHALSPLDDGEELLVLAWESGLASGVELQRWSDSAWHQDASDGWVALANADKRGIALAYEASGDALFVRSDGTANPQFRVRHQGAWSDEAPLFALAPGLGAVQWLELATRRGSDAATLVYADALSALYAVVWNGSAWETADVATLEILLRTTSSRSFDVAYEEASGDALVIWAGPLNAAEYATRAAGSASWTSSSGIAGLGFTPACYDLAQELGSDRIAMAGLEDAAAGSEPKCAMWTGSAWSDVRRLETGSGVTLGALAGDLGIAAGWVGAAGKAVAIYADDGSGSLDWGMWTSGTGWSLQSDVAIPGKGTTESVLLAAFPDRDQLFAALSDSGSDLFVASYDGTNWTVANGGAALETGLSSIDGVPFDVEPRGD